MMDGKVPIIVLNVQTERESGRKAQLSNIQAGKAVASIIRSTLGPKAMLKMMLDPIGGICMTNDGNAILREIDVVHPAAKSMIELSRAQDEEVGDGTTSVIILAGEMLKVSTDFFEKEIHPSVVVSGYYKALEDAINYADSIATPVNIENEQEINDIIKSCLATKFASKWDNLISDLALKAVKIVYNKDSKVFDCDIKKYAKVEKIPGGELSECVVLDGVVLNKDVIHPQMRRKIENPRIVLLDSTLEYKKGESQTNCEFTKESDFTAALEQEKKEVKKLCEQIIKVKPDLVITEKGASDLAAYYLQKANISVIRRLRKTDNNRVAKAVGATIVNRPEELTENDVGKNCGLFEIKKIGDEYYAYFVKCKNPKACSIILRGASKDVLHEMQRNLDDAMCVCRNIFREPKLVPGGGAFEMEISARLIENSKNVEGLIQLPYKAVARALEVIPRTLIQNCGADVVRTITDLRAKHADPNNKDKAYLGVDGNKGVIANMKDLKIFDTLAVKKQTLKTSIESSCMILRIDDIVSGIKKKEKSGSGPQQPDEDQETFGDQRDG
ncbi:MAG: T-complex protein 1 subunit gamma [Clostridia bacterium]|nr:T-complex protein 1 subunit gamma [Clostridia bacterium]